MPTKNPNVDVIATLEDRFELLETGLVYVDAPLEGFVREKETAEFFAFRVTTIVADCLWHWTLVPVDTLSSPVRAAFTVTEELSPRWISIIEDRRGEPPSLSVVRFTEGAQRIPASMRDA